MSNTYHERHTPTGETETRLAIFPKIKKTNLIIESIEDKEKGKSTIFREKEGLKVTKVHNRRVVTSNLVKYDYNCLRFGENLLK